MPFTPHPSRPSCPRVAALLLCTTLGASACSAADQADSGTTKAPATAPATQPAGAVKKITIDEFDKRRQEKDVVVLDVRTPQEFAAGHVPGAVNIPVTGPGSADFADQVAKLDKGKPYLVYCAKGGRSVTATSKMQKLGFTGLSDYSGGMNEWTKEGKPIEKGGDKPQDAKPSNAK